MIRSETEVLHQVLGSATVRRLLPLLQEPLPHIVGKLPRHGCASLAAYLRADLVGGVVNPIRNWKRECYSQKMMINFNKTFNVR